MSTQTFTTVEGLNAALRKLPKLAADELRDASRDIAADVASTAGSRGRGASRGWPHLAPTLRASRDRVPVIRMGGTKKLPGRGGKRQTVGDILWGLEFGGRGRPRTMQFAPHLGTTGYVLWPTVRAMGDEIDERYGDALMDALGKIR